MNGCETAPQSSGANEAFACDGPGSCMSQMALPGEELADSSAVDFRRSLDRP